MTRSLGGAFDPSHGCSVLHHRLVADFYPGSDKRGFDGHAHV